MPVVLDGSPKSEVVVAAPDFQFQPSLSRVSLESSFNLKDDLPERVGSRQPNNGSTGQPKSPETQTPAEHWSPKVAGSPSLQDAVLLDVTQPLAESQLSSVQALPSSQATLLSAKEHPLAGSQLSSVHKLPSSQSGGRPPTQVPALQLSPVVQALPSSQAPATLTLKQPPPRSQLSSVQTLPSSQSGGAPPAQAPALQVSTVVQALPSSQAKELFE
jgi:hypothetical protein